MESASSSRVTVASFPPESLLSSPLGPLVVTGVNVLRGALASETRDSVQVTSWWRSPAHNREVGGEPFSQHLVGLAFDVVGPGSVRVAQRWREAGGVAVQTPTHVHLQVWPAGTLERLLTAAA